MSLRSYTILKRELRTLKEFRSITITSYAQVSGLLNIRGDSKNELDGLLRENGIEWGVNECKLRKHSTRNNTESLLSELVLVRAISALEIFLTDAIRDIFVVTKAPFMDRSIRIDLSQEDLIANNSPAKLLNRVINNETRKLSSGGFKEFIKYYKKRFDIDLAAIPPGYKLLNEYHDRRHLLVHRLGQTDEQYRKTYLTDEKRLKVDAEYIDRALSDIKTFCYELSLQINRLISGYESKGATYNARYVIDLLFLNDEVPNCLQPDFQYWADDEYVAMTDILIGTSPADEGRVRYYFTGSDRALRRLKRYLRREIKRLTISMKVEIDRVRTAHKNKNLSEEKLQMILDKIPEQPWNTGMHKEVAKELGLKNSVVSSAISIFIMRGLFKHQVNGEIVG